MRVSTNRFAFFAVFLCVVLGAPTVASAQARPEGPHRFWLELGLGASRQNADCPSCFQQQTIGGPATNIVGGVTLTPDFGVALLYREFSQLDLLSDAGTHSASYYLGLVQYSPASIRPFVFNFGIGGGQQHGDAPPYGDNGSGMAVSAGIAVRLPARSRFGLSLNADWIKTVTGNLSTAAGQPPSSYHPSLITFGLGVNFATASPASPAQ